MRRAPWIWRSAYWGKAVRDAIIRRITRERPLLFDGALGTRLIARGLTAGTPPEDWVLRHPEQLQEVHRGYAEAGSEVVAACTFGANRLRLCKAGLEEKIEAINLEAVRLAREAVGKSIYVAADIGPTGEFLEPFGNLPEAEAEAAFEEQATYLAQTEVDFLFLETFYDLREARIALKACRRAAPRLPIVASLTFNRKPRGFFTVMGDPAVASLRILREDGAFLVGSNCTLEAKGMLELAKVLIPSELQAPLVLQPNAGEPQMTSEGIVYPQDAEMFGASVAEMIALGVRAVGGCCGTDESHIRVIRRYLEK
jgi:5-methyltetrahydrofolate--homocysteine methyltransferase